MGRILAIDYGRKRCGIAVTDILQITPGGLCTVRTCDLMNFLNDYISRETVDRILIGKPQQMNGQESESMVHIRPFVRKWQELHPNIPIEFVDERFTSRLAKRAIIEAGIGKQKRQAAHGLIDEVSAVIILQSYMEAQRINL